MDKKNNFLVNMERNQSWMVLLITIILGFFFSIFNKNFLSLSNINAIILNACILIILASAESIVILTGNIDVSVAAILAFSSFIGFDVFVKMPNIGAVGLLVPLFIGGMCGLINGMLVGYLKLSAIIVTLATNSIYRGLAVIYAGGRQINAHEIPTWVNSSINGSVMGVSYLVIYSVLIVLGIHLFLTHFPIGRKIYAVGSNSEAAKYFGLNTKKVIVIAYIIAGIFTGFAGFLYGGRSAYVAPYYAEGWEMQAIAAACIGGISMKGGSGSIFGAALGALMLATIENGLVLMGAPQFVRQMINGGAIVIAIVINSVLLNRIQVMVQKNKAIRRGYNEQAQ